MVKLASGLIEVCIFCFSSRGPEYLLLRRSPHEKIYPDIWQFVSGSIEGSESATEAALREMSEETSLTPDELWVVPHVNIFYDPTHDSLNLTPIFAAQVAPGSIPKLSAEHHEYRWCERSAAAGLLVWPAQHEALRIVHDSIVMGGRAAGLSRL